jgi:hypothetical protein
MLLFDDIKNYLTTLKELYKRIESLDFEFPENYEEFMKSFFEPIELICMIGYGYFPIIERITVKKRVIKAKH